MTLELELNINQLLPPELLLQVLHHLPPSSLLSAVLVCRLWHGLAQKAPQLWAWLHLTGCCQSTHTSAFLFSNLFQFGQLISPQFSLFSVQPDLLCFAGFSLPKNILLFNQYVKISYLTRKSPGWKNQHDVISIEEEDDNPDLIRLKIRSRIAGYVCEQYRTSS